eukprot:TRINITY_DN8460_c0_g1_i1.p1 TRINITY_DN8460_c0_g1~~TRINITY_DN8460_c0_g1_i1.p1  ORF type:complete len:555 (+),score=171.56 TRINITY_DN8460_c0_g1_i1:38-1702(+)
MNLIKAVKDYITKMVETTKEMKVLLMDKETAGIVSIVYSQTVMMEKEVFMFELIDNGIKREPMPHLKCICFVRPSNVQNVAEELRNPKYGEYYLFFSNALKDQDIDTLAEADDQELVKDLTEMYADYLAVDEGVFSLDIPSVILSSPNEYRVMLERVEDGLISCLLSLKKRPIIRYSQKSKLTYDVSNSVKTKIDRLNQENGLFGFDQKNNPLLLVLDRRDDPITPLLSQWTYQAMVHELLGIRNNRVCITKKENEISELVLSSEQDDFYKQNMYNNFGELGENVKNFVDEFSKQTKTNQNIQSLDQIKEFIGRYPQFKKLSGNVSKHVSLISDLSSLISKRKLMDVSEVEQELACNNAHGSAYEKVSALIKDPSITDKDKLKLVILYSLRYETYGSNQTNQLVSELIRQNVPQEMIGLVSFALKYGGSANRSGDLFDNKNVFKMFSKTIMKGIQGVENIYTQHKPAIFNLLDSITKGKLDERDYPFFSQQKINVQAIPNQIIVFIVGGITYEEAKCVHDFNCMKENINFQVILGGTTVHNSDSFMKEIQKINI